MKKQRIFLHTLILVLAAACFGTAAYGWTKYANVKAKNPGLVAKAEVKLGVE